MSGPIDPAVRPFSADGDLDAVLRLLKPEVDDASLAAAREAWSPPPAGERRARLVVGRPAVGYVEVVDRTTTPKKYAETARASPLVVAPAHRRRGLGSALLAAAEAFARGVGTPLLQAETSDAAGHAFAAAHAFAEIARRQALRLDLAAVDAVAMPSTSALRVFDFADSGDARPKLFAIYASAYPAGTYGSIEAWARSYVEAFDPTRELLLIAADGDAWVGMTRVAIDLRPREASTTLTAVLPSHRGRGVGTLLKWHAIDRLRRLGVRTVVTGNRVDNAPMQAINARFGFVPDPPSIVYRKRVG